MEAEDRRIISVFGEFMDMCLEARQQGGGEGPSLRETLVAHFDGPLTKIPVERLEVAAAEFVNLDVALEALVESAGGGSLVGVGGGDQRHHLTFSDMVQGWSSGAPIAPVDRVRVETGPDSSRDAVSFGIHLFRLDDAPVAILQRRSDPRFGEQCGVEVMTDRFVAEQVIAQIKRLMVERNVFRGQVLSFASVGGAYEPATGGVRFHRRPELSADAVILPPGALARVERHVVGTTRHRRALLEAGQHLKRGLLLHGPPGTGKTHTIRYLLGQSTGVTCFLLSGNALGFIGEVATLAQALQPSLIVLEDVDLIAEERGLHGPQPLLFTLLDAMDGLAGESDIAFILSTNRVDLLERALSQRPGRVDLALEIPLPGVAERLGLLRLHTGDLPVSGQALERVAARSEGVTASFFKELTRRTVLVAAQEDVPVDDELLERVLDEMLSDAERLTRSLLGAGQPDWAGEDDAGASADPEGDAGAGFGWFSYGPGLHP